MFGEHFVALLDFSPEVPIDDMLRPIEEAAVLGLAAPLSLIIVLQLIEVHAFLPKQAAALEVLNWDFLHSVVGEAEVCIGINTDRLLLLEQIE